MIEHFENLAGNKDCDKLIAVELDRANIRMVRGVDCKNMEVPYSIAGILGGDITFYNKHHEWFQHSPPLIETMQSYHTFIFERAWVYWVCHGLIPLHIAKELYDDDIGRQYIRVVGHCGCPPPSGWVLSYKVCGYKVVPFYHIDTQEGLNLFVDVIKRNDLI